MRVNSKTPYMHAIRTPKLNLTLNYYYMLNLKHPQHNGRQNSVKSFFIIVVSARLPTGFCTILSH